MNPTDPNPLLPCPFCGTAPIIQNWGDQIRIECGSSACALIVQTFKKPRPDAITLWNTRAPSATRTAESVEIGSKSVVAAPKTPRTDAAMRQLMPNYGGMVKIDFARQLETELTQAQALVTQLSAEREHNANEALAMRAERDEARKLLKFIGSNSENEAGLVISDLTESCRDMKAERDAANALVDRLAAALDKITKLSDSEMRDGDGAREIAESALAEVTKSLSPRTTENTKPQ